MEGSPGQVGADFPAVGSNFGPPSSGRIPLLLREGMADMRQTGFPAKVKKLIAERASATGDAADAYCEVWEVCHGARSGPPHHRRPRGQGGSRRRDTNLPGEVSEYGQPDAWFSACDIRDAPDIAEKLNDGRQLFRRLVGPWVVQPERNQP